MLIRYAKPGAARYGTRTVKGETCFTGLASKRQAQQLAKQWSAEFPDYAPYYVATE